MTLKSNPSQPRANGPTKAGATTHDYATKNGRVFPKRGLSRPNRSLERGLSILRVFRAGATVRGNSEIAEKTGLPRSTVSRLTQTLVACGFLDYDRAANAYRLGAPVLGLAEAFISGSEILAAAAPLMKHVSDTLRVNSSLAVADGDEMVHLHAVRRRDIGLPRRVMTGRRTPMEMTALGRAYLATLPGKEREMLFAGFRAKHRDHWLRLEREIQQAIDQVHEEGYCEVNWLPGVTVIAAPVQLSGQTHVINVGVSPRSHHATRIRSELVPALLTLASELENACSSGQSTQTQRKQPSTRIKDTLRMVVQARSAGV